MLAIFSLLTIVTLSVVMVRVGSIALQLTGLSSEIASFQAQSAFSGAGFTTSEAESIVTHPVRRKIIRILILVGNIGVTSSMATLVLAFIGETGVGALQRGLILLLGLFIIVLFARSKYIYNIMQHLISKALKRLTNLDAFDYEQLLGFNEGYTISRIGVKKESWLVDKKLSDSRLEQEGVLILAIYRRIHGREKFIGAPTGDTLIKDNDVLICYSKNDSGRAIVQRPKDHV